MSCNYVANFFSNFKNSDTCIISPLKSHSYTSVLSDSLKVSHYIKKLELPRQSNIVLELSNSYEIIICYLAVALTEHIVVPLNPDTSQQQKSFIIEASKAALHIKDVDLVRSILQKNSPSKLEVIPFSTRQENDIYATFYTSGTSGNPKAASYSFKKMILNAKSFNELHDFNKFLRLYHLMPMTYMAGFLNTILCPLECGGSLFIGKQFNAINATTIWEEIYQSQCNAIWLTPTIISFSNKFMKDNWDKRLSHSLGHVFCGTAPLHIASCKEFETKFGVKCLESFGMTETLLVSCNTLKHQNIGTVGRLLKDILIETKKDKDEMSGEIIIHSPYIADSIYNNGLEEFPDNKIESGDLGVYEEEFLQITGRKKDLIIKGGKNLSPKLIEDLILKYTNLNEVAVIGTPHSTWGEEVTCIIQTISPKIDLETRKNVKEILPRDLRPGRFHFVDEIPKNINGKILKKDLQNMLSSFYS